MRNGEQKNLCIQYVSNLYHKKNQLRKYGYEHNAYVRWNLLMRYHIYDYIEEGSALYGIPYNSVAMNSIEWKWEHTVFIMIIIILTFSNGF